MNKDGGCAARTFRGETPNGAHGAPYVELNTECVIRTLDRRHARTRTTPLPADGMKQDIP